MGTWVVGFAAGALAYSAIAMLGLLLAGRVVGWRPASRILPAIYVTLVFVFMTQHPFPARDVLICPVQSATPQFYPFSYWNTAEHLWHRAAPVAEWLSNRMIASTVMNFVICAMIGLAVGRAGLRPTMALVFGIVLTLVVEVTQLTGLWGLYPCAYRQFNVDDLILNTLGVLFGAAIWTRRNAPNRLQS